MKAKGLIQCVLLQYNSHESIFKFAMMSKNINMQVDYNKYYGSQTPSAYLEQMVAGQLDLARSYGHD